MVVRGNVLAIRNNPHGKDPEIMSRKVYYTEIDRRTYSWTEAIPGTRQRETVYGTTIIEVQDWADVPENGIYRDRSYQITKAYRSSRPDTLGQLVGHSSSPWTGRPVFPSEAKAS